MDHGKEHHHGSHHAATQHGKKGHEHSAESKHSSHTEESQAPRTGFQLGQAGTGYGNNKTTELSSFANTKEFEDLEAESHSNSGHEREEHADHDDDDKHEDHHGKK